MKLIRAATLSVADLDRSLGLYTSWLDYTIDERGKLETALAKSWGADAAAGRPYAVLRPASRHNIFLRLVQVDRVPSFVPLTSYGWAAIEICVQDVLDANERLHKSPFEVIGPPREIEGLDAIYPMQIKGPDGEIVYLTQIRDDLPEFDLPRAAATDRSLVHPGNGLFRHGCIAGLARSSRRGLPSDAGAWRSFIRCSLKRSGTPESQLYAISTMVHGRDVFLELDQLPAGATTRPRHAGDLPPGVALGSFWHPDFAAIDQRCQDEWITPPERYDSAIYLGKRAATMRAPDGTLVEMIETD